MRCATPSCGADGTFVPRIRLPGDLGEVRLPDSKVCLDCAVDARPASDPDSPLGDLIARALKLKGPWGASVDVRDPSIEVTFTEEWG